MNERTLSERLESLAIQLEASEGDYDIVVDIAKELRKLSTETYAPGNSLSWRDVKPPKKNATRTDKFGRVQPF